MTIQEILKQIEALGSELVEKLKDVFEDDHEASAAAKQIVASTAVVSDAHAQATSQSETAGATDADTAAGTGAAAGTADAGTASAGTGDVAGAAAS